jgi:hypothetical protein
MITKTEYQFLLELRTQLSHYRHNDPRVAPPELIDQLLRLGVDLEAIWREELRMGNNQSQS